MLHINLVGIPQATGLHNSSAKKKTKKTYKFNVATWNVRTMLDCDSQSERRTALISKELARYTIDVAALQETRLEGQEQIQESTHTFFWIGQTAGRRDAGVAFAIADNIAGKLSSLPCGISERLMHLRIPLAKERFLSMINVYVPTMTYTDEEKEGFYEELAAVVDAVPVSDKLLILGDFNTRVGKDYRTHRRVLQYEL